MNKSLLLASALIIPLLVGCNKADNTSTSEVPSSSDVTETIDYYERNSVSTLSKENELSETEQLFRYINNTFQKVDYDEQKADEAKFGRKFYVSFVKNGCGPCHMMQPGFQYLESHWGQDEFVNTTDNKTEFKGFVVIANEGRTDKKGNERFLKLLDDYAEIFESISSEVENRPYYRYSGNIHGNYAQLVQGMASASTFATPTNILFDFDFKDALSFGATDVIFNINNKEGNIPSHDIAKTLSDCWNHTGIFSF